MTQNTIDIVIDGVIDSHGQPWFRISKSTQRLFVAARDFAGNRKVIVQTCAEHGIVFADNKAEASFFHAVAKTKHFAFENLIIQGGHNTGCFVLPDGQAFFAERGSQSEVALKPLNGKCALRGKLKKWGHLAELASQNPVSCFVMLSAFMPPLLEFAERGKNIAFEIVGGGHSTAALQALAASALGRPAAYEQSCYPVDFGWLVHNVDHARAIYKDLLIITELPNLAEVSLSDKQKARVYEVMAGNLLRSSYQPVGTLVDQVAHHGVLLFTEFGLAEQMGRNSEKAKAQSNGLYSIYLPPDTPYGYLEKLPEKYPSAEEYVDALLAGARAQHGTAIRGFIAKLVDECFDDKKGLQEKLRASVKRFRKKSGVDPANPAAVMVADAFGLVYAAGILAIEYGVLPKSTKCGSAALTCYQFYSSNRDPVVPFAERLIALADHPDTVVIPNGDVDLATASLIEGADLFVRVRKRHRELLIRSKRVRQVLPDWDTLKGQGAVRELMEQKDGRNTVQITLIPKAKKTRVVCFKIAPSSVTEAPAPTRMPYADQDSGK